MSKKIGIKVSVVIPVYNDEAFMENCLKAVQNQSVKPYEIIVVDNNCSDGSISIARHYKTKVIAEPRQGLCYARQTGLNVARGDILLRIDADTVLPKNYIEKMLAIFANEPNIAAVSGYGVSRFELIPGTSHFWGWCYFKYTYAYFGYPMLWGANMAIKSANWKKLKNNLINNDDLVHEDQDISLALAYTGGHAIQDRNLIISVQMESAQHFSKYNNYVHRMRNLKKINKYNPRTKLKRRIKKLAMIQRFVYWVLTAWSVYALYLMASIYSAFWNLNYWLKSH